MKQITAILATAILSAIATWFLPWWMIGIVSFIVAVFLQLRPGKAFLLCFAGIVLFWLVAILFRDIANDHILSARLAKLFNMPDYGLFIVVNLLVGGLLGGLGGLAGGLMNSAFRRK